MFDVTVLVYRFSTGAAYRLALLPAAADAAFVLMFVAFLLYYEHQGAANTD
jgi:hypothetical protein